jgi:hypothetical protein
LAAALVGSPSLHRRAIAVTPHLEVTTFDEWIAAQLGVDLAMGWTHASWCEGLPRPPGCALIRIAAAEERIIVEGWP